MLIGAVLMGSLLADVRFLGRCACPSPGEVARAFAPLASGAGGREQTVAISITARSGGAFMRWEGAGVDPAERVLPAELSCAERAQAAAVIVAADLMARAAEPAARAPAPVVSGPAIPVIAAHTAQPAPPVAGGARTELELSMQGAHAGAALAPGARAGLAHTSAGQHQLRLAVGVTGTERAAVAGGWATWSRTALALGYGRHMPWGSGGAASAGFLDLGVEALASRLRLGSEGFHRTELSVAFHPGLGASARAGRRVSRFFAASAGLGATLWPRPHRVYLRDMPETVTLPRLELMATIGVSWAIW
jgi:hypothetical protein